MAGNGDVNELRARGIYPEGWTYGSSASFARGVDRGAMRPLAYRGLDPGRTLGWSRWNVKLQDNYDTLSDADGIFTLTYQRSDAEIRRVDVPGRCGRGGICLLPTTGSVWRSDRPVHFDQFYLRRDRVAEVCETLNERALEPGDVEPFTGVYDPGFASLLEEIGSVVARDDASELEVDGCAQWLAETLLRCAPTYGRVEPRPASLRGPTLTRVLDYIDAHLDESIHVQQIAEVAGISTFHLIRAFRSAMGRTPHQYLLERRIQRARERLRETDDPIATIALDLGFASQAHFSDVFRRRMEQSPGRFRRACREGN